MRIIKATLVAAIALAPLAVAAAPAYADPPLGYYCEDYFFEHVGDGFVSAQGALCTPFGDAPALGSVFDFEIRDAETEETVAECDEGTAIVPIVVTGEVCQLSA